ncbi:MAG: Gx transporter family protein [Clostridia bacterium]|nr:Gx transporter family protein [Clostridia bacterium]
MRKYWAAKKISMISLFTALSLIVFVIENQFPSMLIPGARMGLANIFSFAALIMYSPAEGFIVVAARTLLGAIFAGNITSVLYSFTAGMVSMAVSALLLCLAHPRVSIMAISIAAAVCHNITQNLIFVWMSGTIYAMYYMPYLMLLGVVSGAIVGGVTMLIFKKVPMSVFANAAGYRKFSKSDMEIIKPKKADKTDVFAETEDQERSAETGETNQQTTESTLE